MAGSPRRPRAPLRFEPDPIGVAPPYCDPESVHTARARPEVVLDAVGGMVISVAP